MADTVNEERTIDDWLVYADELTEDGDPLGAALVEIAMKLPEGAGPDALALAARLAKIWPSIHSNLSLSCDFNRWPKHHLGVAVMSLIAAGALSYPRSSGWVGCWLTDPIGRLRAAVVHHQEPVQPVKAIGRVRIEGGRVRFEGVDGGLLIIDDAYEDTIEMSQASINSLRGWWGERSMAKDPRRRGDTGAHGRPRRR